MPICDETEDFKLLNAICNESEAFRVSITNRNEKSCPRKEKMRFHNFWQRFPPKEDPWSIFFLFVRSHTHSQLLHTISRLAIKGNLTKLQFATKTQACAFWLLFAMKMKNCMFWLPYARKMQIWCVLNSTICDDNEKLCVLILICNDNEELYDLIAICKENDALYRFDCYLRWK